jgi:hypothetical protein
MTQNEYRDECTSLAREALRESKGDRDAAAERVREAVDGHEWIIYTRHNFDVLKHCTDEAHGIDEGLVDANAALKDGGLGKLLMQLAFWSMEQDVLEALGREPDPEDDDEE